jgi:hypothetical protein
VIAFCFNLTLKLVKKQWLFAARLMLSRPSAAVLTTLAGVRLSRPLSAAAIARYSDAALICGASVVGCARTGGRSRKGFDRDMTEPIIKARTGVYGRVNVTLPLPAKVSMLSWVKKSGMKKAQFFRTALMIGALQLANDLNAKEPNEGYFDNTRLSADVPPTRT